MKQIGIILLFAVATSAALAQETETRQLARFNGVRVSEAIDVYLKKGDKESARVEVDGVSLSDVETDISGNVLRVHMASGNHRNRTSVKVYVTYVDINRISCASAANVFTDGVLKANNLEITCASAGSVELKLDAGNLSIEIASAGDITLEGKAKSVTIDAASAGTVDAYNLEAERVDAKVGSAGSAKVNVTKSLNAEANSGGSIRYRGNPTSTNIDSNSGGSVKKSS